jgi:hypothetical protein
MSMKELINPKPPAKKRSPTPPKVPAPKKTTTKTRKTGTTK